MKHLLIILSILLLSSPVIGEETGVLFLRLENGEVVYSEEGDDDNDAKYVGELKDGKPSGQGTLTNPSSGGKYVGEWKDGARTGQGTFTLPDGGTYVGGWKDGKYHGQGTYTFSNGGKGIGDFREDNPWNITEYDKNGNIIGKIVNGEQQ